MKIKYGNDYYKVLDSEIPPNYHDLVTMLPEIISPEPLPPIYHLRYRDLEEFPIKVSNQRSYKVMLEEKKKSQGEIILFITTDDQEEDFPNINTNIRALAYDGQANHIPPFPSLNYKDSCQYQPLTRNSLTIGMKKEEANIFPMMNSNSPPTTVDEVVRNENPQGDYNKRFLQPNGSFEFPKISPVIEDPALRLVASVLDALNDERIEKKNKKIEAVTGGSENEGPKLRSSATKESKEKTSSSKKRSSSTKKDSDSSSKDRKKKNHPRPSDKNDENVEVLVLNILRSVKK